MTIQPMPGDEFVTEPILSTSHQTILPVRADAVWPWLVQMGSGRAGWYSWDWIDNLGRKSAVRILAQYQSLSVGDIVPGYPGAQRMFIVRDIQVESHLVLGVPCDENSDYATYALALSDHDDGTTLLRARLRLGALTVGRLPVPNVLVSGPLRLGHHIMQTKQFRELRWRCISTT